MRAEVIKDDFLPTIAKAAGGLDENDVSAEITKPPIITTKIDDTSPVKAFLAGTHCLTGVSLSLLYDHLSKL